MISYRRKDTSAYTRAIKISQPQQTQRKHVVPFVRNPLRERFPVVRELLEPLRGHLLEAQPLADAPRKGRRENRRDCARTSRIRAHRCRHQIERLAASDPARQHDRVLAHLPADAATLIGGQRAQEHQLEQAVGVSMPEQIDQTVHGAHKADQCARVRFAAVLLHERVKVAGNCGIGAQVLWVTNGPNEWKWMPFRKHCEYTCILLMQ